MLDIIGEKFLASLALMLTAWAFSGILGFTIGCIMGNLHGKWPDKILKKLCLTMCVLSPPFDRHRVPDALFSAVGLVPPWSMSVPERAARRSGHHLAADSSPNPSCPSR